jgi:hypothetical protein
MDLYALELLAEGLIIAFAVFNVFLTIIGIREWKRLKLCASAVYALGVWVFMAALALRILNREWSFWFFINAPFFMILVAAAAVSIKEAGRRNSILKTIGKLSFKDRLLGKYPQNIAPIATMPQVQPRTPPLAFAALSFVAGNAAFCIMSELIYLSFLSETDPISRLIGFDYGFSGDPTMMTVYSALLFLAFLLICRRFYASGGMIGLVVGTLSLFQGFLGLFSGWWGIAGGLSAIAQRLNERRTQIKNKIV